ncbi:hypothetical protein ACOSQ4_031810 [Xanthoceras sorbifolium]
MKSNGEVISDIQIMEKIPRTLNAKFEYKVTAIEELKDPETMNLDELLKKPGLDANPALNTYECLDVLHMLMYLMF